MFSFQVDEQIRAMEAMAVLMRDQVKSKQYSKAQSEMVRSTQKTDELLYSIFPRHIADTLKAGGTQKIPCTALHVQQYNTTQCDILHYITLHYITLHWACNTRQHSTLHRPQANFIRFERIRFERLPPHRISPSMTLNPKP